MRERARRPSLVGPLILITIGVLLLLNQTGRLRWDVLGSLWRYWPVILILLGIEALIGASQSRVLYLLGVLIAVAVLAGLVGYVMLQGAETPAQRPATATETLSQGLQDAERGLVRLRLGAGEIKVGALADSPNLVEGKIEYGERSRKVVEQLTVRNSQAEYELSGGPENSLWAPGTNTNETWQLRFTPRVPLEMRIDMGAGSVQADLSGLKITGLDVNMGVGSTELTLPAVEGSATISVKLPIGGVTVVVPPGVGVRMRTNKLLTSVNVGGGRFTHSGDEWVSDNYATSASKIDLRIDNVMGSIDLR
jgi:hypothetical protein